MFSYINRFNNKIKLVYTPSVLGYYHKLLVELTGTVYKLQIIYFSSANTTLYYKYSLHFLYKVIIPFFGYRENKTD